MQQVYMFMYISCWQEKQARASFIMSAECCGALVKQYMTMHVLGIFGMMCTLEQSSQIMPHFAALQQLMIYAMHHPSVNTHAAIQYCSRHLYTYPVIHHAVLLIGLAACCGQDVRTCICVTSSFSA